MTSAVLLAHLLLSQEPKTTFGTGHYCKSKNFQTYPFCQDCECQTLDSGYQPECFFLKRSSNFKTAPRRVWAPTLQFSGDAYSRGL